MDGNPDGTFGRRQYLKATAGAVATGSVGLTGCLSAGEGEDFPSETITWINPSSGGGGYGAFAQGISKHAPEHLPNDVEMSVTSVNDWIQGTSRIHRADADGYTIGWIDVPGAVGNQVAKDVPYDLKECTLLNRVAFHPFSIAVPADSEYESLEDMQAADEVTFGSPGGGVASILGAVSTDALDIPMKLITGYSGSNGTITGMLRGDFEAVSLPPSTPPMTKALKNDEIRLIVLFAQQRSELAPDAPTAAELGYDDLTGTGLNRLVGGPPGIDDDRADVLSEAIEETIASDGEFRQWAKDKAKHALFTTLKPEGREAAREILDQGFENMRANEDILEQHL
ncbi:hypothetical protein BRC81_10580 [Halobacteriales archaeon QS_1_68_20]|nr:MAG: hypothetical protein BRC81_10580 [Halobacteriales archaeon QS_1_68_20]